MMSVTLESKPTAVVYSKECVGEFKGDSAF